MVGMDGNWRCPACNNAPKLATTAFFDSSCDHPEPATRLLSPHFCRSTLVPELIAIAARFGNQAWSPGDMTQIGTRQHVSSPGPGGKGGKGSGKAPVEGLTLLQC